MFTEMKELVSLGNGRRLEIQRRNGGKLSHQSNNCKNHQFLKQNRCISIWIIYVSPSPVEPPNSFTTGSQLQVPLPGSPSTIPLSDMPPPIRGWPPSSKMPSFILHPSSMPPPPSGMASSSIRSWPPPIGDGCRCALHRAGGGSLRGHDNQIDKYLNMLEEKGFLKKCPQIEPTSDDWKIIEFKLQLTLGTTAAIVKRIYDISNTHVSSSFSSYAKGSIVLESFIETEKLVDQNKLEKVCQKGFDIGEEGMLFSVGYNKHIDVRAQKEFSFVMGKIAVGKSYCYEASKFREQPIECPEGFDSVYLYNEQSNPQVFLHNYVIFKNYQVYPVYLIDFVIDSYKERQSKHPVCENCDKIPPSQAKQYCITEEVHLCYDCHQDHHASKLSSKHKVVDIDEKPKKFGFCPHHEESKLELYCNVCYEALCINCKINGDHVAGEMGEHQLVSLKDAYSDIPSKVREIDPNIERRKNQLTEDLSKIDLKIKEVNTKATHVEEQIYSHFQKALNELQVETQRKLSFLIGDQLELKRQFDHIQWMDSFVRYSLEIQEPHEFLQSWYKYSKYKKEVLSLANLSINTEVKADMKIEGSIHVVVESKKKKGVDTNLVSNQSLMREPTLDHALVTPTRNEKASFEKDLGTTQLRKTVFKKHYLEKTKNIGEPNTMKGSYDNRNPFTPANKGIDDD